MSSDQGVEQRTTAEDRAQARPRLQGRNTAGILKAEWVAKLLDDLTDALAQLTAAQEREQGLVEAIDHVHIIAGEERFMPQEILDMVLDLLDDALRAVGALEREERE